LSTKKKPSPVEGQLTFDDIFRAKVEELKKPLMRIARANAILEFIDRVNYSNIKLGAIGGFGETSYMFSFDQAYGARVNRNGKYVEGKSYEKVANEAAESAVLAELAANRACEACEYADGCPRKNRLYEKLCSPDKVDVRNTLRTRMRAVIKSEGAKTMSCLKAAASVRPKKADWDW